MDAFFTGLTKSQAMLLLTAVTFGGQEGVESFDHLPDDEADVLRDRAKQILAIPRERRVPFLVQEIKRFITGRRADGLRAADPKRVAEALADERPATVEVVLRALPASIANDVRLELAQPVMELDREVRQDVLAIIRWKFEERLAEIMPERPSFAVTDLLVVSGRDLFCLADVLGAKALAPAISALPAEERDALLARLPPDQRQLISRPTPAPARRVDPETARRTLEQALAAGEPRQAVRAAGVRRIARACLGESVEFAARVIEQHNDEFGRALARSVSEERQAPKRPDPVPRSEVLAELERLAARGVIERPVRLPPPPMPRRPLARPEPRVSLPSSPRQSLPSAPRPSLSSAPRPASPTIQRGGAAAERPSREYPDRRPVVVRPSPMRGPRKP